MELCKYLHFIRFRLLNAYSHKKFHKYDNKMMINYLHHLELINKETYMNIYKDQLNDKEILFIENIINDNQDCILDNCKSEIPLHDLVLSDAAEFEDMGIFTVTFNGGELKIGKTKMLQSKLYVKLLFQDGYIGDSLTINLEVTYNAIDSIYLLLSGETEGNKYLNKIKILKDFYCFLNIFDYLDLNFQV